MVESPIILLGIRDVLNLEAGIRNFKVKSGRDSGLKVSAWDAECKRSSRFHAQFPVSVKSFW